MQRRPSAATSRIPEHETYFRTLMLLCLVVGLSYLAARVGAALLPRPEVVAPLWQANAILISVLLLLPRRNWPAFIIVGPAASIFFDLRVGVPARGIAFFLLSDAVEILIAAVCLSYLFHGIPQLDSLRALAKYSIIAVILAPAAATSIGAFTSAGSYWTSWKISFLPEALEFLVLMPAILGWFHKGRTWAQKSLSYYLEAVALLAVLAFWGYLTFDTFRRGYSPVLLYSLVPFLFWATGGQHFYDGSIRGIIGGVGPFASGELAWHLRGRRESRNLNILGVVRTL